MHERATIQPFMRPLLQYLPPLMGACYVAIGVALGLRSTGLDVSALLGAALALVTGLGAAAAASQVEGRPGRYPLLAASLVAPIALLPAFYQLAPAAAPPLRHVALAIAFHAIWSLSLPLVGKEDGSRRWPWLIFVYGGALAVAGYRNPILPWLVVWFTGLWAVALLIQVRRLRWPSTIMQETIANRLLWTVMASALAGLVTLRLLPLDLRTDLAWGSTSAVMTWGLWRAAVAIQNGDTSFSAREPLASVGAMALAGVIPWLIGDPGPWPLATLAIAAITVALLAPPFRGLLREALEHVPPKAALALEEAAELAADEIQRADALEDIGEALRPVARALPRGSVGIVSFDPDQSLLLRDGDVELRDGGPGKPLHVMLAPPRGPRPILASRVCDRSVRETPLRPAADLIEQLETDLIIPLPGGPKGSLGGALFVGKPRHGSQRGRRAATLEELGKILGPRFHSLALLDKAGARIGDMEREHFELEDRLEHLHHDLERTNGENRLLRADRAGTAPTEIVGRSAAMQATLTALEQAAASNTHLTLHGEAGCGRSLFARSVHEWSERRQGALVRFNCSDEAEETHVKALLGNSEGELERPGLIELADQGTLVLEEVGSLSLDAQSELVRVLASGEVARVGGAALRRVDLVVIGTTGRTSELVQGREVLLPELRDRLGALEVLVPPLKERRGDIAELAGTFLGRTARQHGLDVTGFDPEAVELLESYSWPGNVHQLRAVVDHAVMSARGKQVKASDLSSLGARRDRADRGFGEASEALEGTFEEIERRVLSHALTRAKGNKAEAARLLSMKRTTLNSRLKKLDLD